MKLAALLILITLSACANPPRASVRTSVDADMVVIEARATLDDALVAQQATRQAMANQQAVKMAKVEAVRNMSATVEPETTQSRSGLSEKRKGQLADVYGHFADGQEVSVQDMANTLGVHERTARRVAADGVAHGVFVNPSRGVYFKNGVNPDEL